VTAAGSIDIVLDHNAGTLRRGDDLTPARAAALDLLPAVEDALLVQLDEGMRGGELAGHDVLWSREGRLLLALGAQTRLVGSRAYAASLKARDAQIAAVVCCAMIGFNADNLRTFEVHAGYTDPAVRDLSVPLAQVVARAVSVAVLELAAG